MARFACKELAELAHQLTLAPRRQRLEQVRGIDHLLALVQPDKAYPYDMVCFHITGYRNRRRPEKALLAGDKLTADLVLMAEYITRKAPIAIAELGADFCTYEQLAERLQVSTKTVRRWRVRGLMGLRALGADGVSRLVYLEETIRRFVERNGALVRRGSAFRQLTPQERDSIVDQARQLLAERRLKLHLVARTLAERTGRAVETIRYTLRRWDQANPERALFSGNGWPSLSAAHRQVWRAYQQGRSADSMAEEFGLPVATVRAMVREMCVRHLKANPITFVYNELFDAPNADALILDRPMPAGAELVRKVRVPRDLPPYLRALYDIPLMTAEQEADTFRRYNYLKHKAARLLAGLDPETAADVDLATFEDLRGRYELVRQEIVKANLRLVVSIAKKHVGRTGNFFEIVSDGNISLLRAVERFDYARGYKFSTYATWAVMKNYARTVPEEHYHGARYVTGQDELLAAAPDSHPAAENSAMDEDRLAEALREGMRELNERERTIVTSHYGLFGSGQSVTLEELGRRYGVTKERVRQIERRALGKIRALISPEMAELLPS